MGQNRGELAGETWGRNGNKALSLRDARYALDHFRNLRRGEGESSKTAEEELSSASTQSDKTYDQKAQKQALSQGTQ
jgi:DNA-directed RNA polymerase subunit F